MFIWEKNILMPDKLHERLIDAIGMKNHIILQPMGQVV